MICERISKEHLFITSVESQKFLKNKEKVADVSEQKSRTYKLEGSETLNRVYLFTTRQRDPRSPNKIPGLVTHLCRNGRESVDAILSALRSCHWTYNVPGYETLRLTN